jgi:hypothetical protein
MHYQGTLTEAKFSLDYLLLTIETLFTFFCKKSYLNEEVNRRRRRRSILSLPWQHLWLLKGSPWLLLTQNFLTANKALWLSTGPMRGFIWHM